MRLSKTDVRRVDETGYLEEQTSFGKNKFVYALQRTDTDDKLSATFDAGKLAIFVPALFIKNWPENDVVGFDGRMELTGTDSLYLLVEKDFTCIDATTENQADNYENPNKTC